MLIGNASRGVLLATTTLVGWSGATRAVDVSTAGAASATEPSAALEEIVVTAQRRSETLQKSSLAIQVLGAAQLRDAGITQATDLNAAVPGLQIAQTGSVTQIFIRGVGDISTNPTNNPAVAANVDGVYVARPSNISSNFYDLARIEVLKGPQGTLYGRNASGGAVNVITNEPSFNGISGYSELEIGNYALKKFDGAINLPLGPDFALRAAMQYIERNGYVSDGTNDQQNLAGRIRALWRPSDNVSVHVNLDVARDGGKGSGWVMRPELDPSNPWLSISSPQGNALIEKYSPPIPVVVSDGQASRQDNHYYNLSVQTDINLDFATLTLLPAFRKTEEDYSFWPGWFFGQKNASNESSFEARLGNNTELLKWVLGGYYFREDQNSSGHGETSALVQNISLFYHPSDTAYAGFGQATYSVLPALRIIGGLRYTREKKGLTGESYDQSLLTGPDRLAEVFGPEGETFSSVTWKAGLEYDVAPESMAYLTASTGFKAGGLNLSAAPNSYKPEKLTAYELGIRNRFLDDRLQLNVELYWWKYNNKQESAVTLTPDGNLSDLVHNAADATIKGASLDAVFRLTSADQLRAYAEYNDTRYDSFKYTTPTAAFNPAGIGCSYTPGALNVAINCTGFQLVHAPLWTGSVGYEHHFDLGQVGRLIAETDAQISSSYWLAPDFSVNERAPSYILENFNLTYIAPAERWQTTAYVHNIGNRAVYTGGTQLPLQAPLFAANIDAPRTYGLRFRYNF